MTHARRQPSPSPEALADIFRQCGFRLTRRQIEQFWMYHGLLRRHNPDLNLTRIHNFTNMVLKLYVDSALPARIADLPSPLMDLGTGPGMPGIPLKIIRPELDILLVEGRAVRTAFLEEAVAALGLENITVCQRKVTPDFSADMAGIITRAVEGIDRTLARVSGCLQRGGQVFFMKGPDCDSEIEQADKLFAGRFERVADHAYRIGQTSHQRRLVVYRRLDEPVFAKVRRASRRHAITAIDSEGNSRFKSLKKLLTGRGLKKADQALMSGRRQIADMLARHPGKCLAWITCGENDPPPADSPESMAWLQLAKPLYESLDSFGTRAPLLCIAAEPPAPWTPDQGFPARLQPAGAVPGPGKRGRRHPLGRRLWRNPGDPPGRKRPSLPPQGPARLGRHRAVHAPFARDRPWPICPAICPSSPSPPRERPWPKPSSRKPSACWPAWKAAACPRPDAPAPSASP